MNAPVELNPKDLPESFSETEEGEEERADKRMLTWWLFDHSRPKEHYSVNPGLEVIRQAVLEHGPFEGIIGFSQGASFASIVSSYFSDSTNGREKIPGQGPLKFAIICSGFVPRSKPILSEFFSSPIPTPSIHVIGLQDKVVSNPRSIELYKMFAGDSRRLLQHPGAHIIPKSDSDIETIIGFVNSTCSPKSKL